MTMSAASASFAPCKFHHQPPRHLGGSSSSPAKAEGSAAASTMWGCGLWACGWSAWHLEVCTIRRTGGPAETQTKPSRGYLVKAQQPKILVLLKEETKKSCR